MPGSSREDPDMNTVTASGGTVDSQPVDPAGNSVVFVGVTTVVGAAALDAPAGIEVNADLSNGTPHSPIAPFASTAGPSHAGAICSGAGARTVCRLVVDRKRPLMLFS